MPLLFLLVLVLSGAVLVLVIEVSVRGGGRQKRPERPITSTNTAALSTRDGVMDVVAHAATTAPGSTFYVLPSPALCSDPTCLWGQSTGE